MECRHASLTPDIKEISKIIFLVPLFPLFSVLYI